MADHYAPWMLVVQFLTLAAALVGAITGVWNTLQFRESRGRVDTLETAHDAHVDTPGLPRHA